MEDPITVSHSSSISEEESNSAVEKATIVIGHHIYASRFVVADVPLDIILSMPWHVDTNPSENYEKISVKLDDVKLFERQKPVGTDHKEVIISVKKFKRVQKKGKYVMFGVTEIQNVLENDQGFRKDDKQLKRLLLKFQSVFKSYRLPGLHPTRNVTYEILIAPDSKIPFRGIYPLSPDELLATNQCSKGTARKRDDWSKEKSVWGDAFFVKLPWEAMRSIVDERGLNRETKRNSMELLAPTKRTTNWWSECIFKNG